jgi:hypothetical protein
MGKACNMNGRDEKCIQDFCQKNVKVGDLLEDLGIDGRIILK